MSNISLGGGLGGISGGEAKPLKGLSDVGKAGESDITKFQEGLSGKPDAQGPSGQSLAIKDQPGPLDFQPNRIKDADIAKKPSLGDQLIGKAKDFISIGRNQEKTLIEKMQKAGKNGFTEKDTMEIQFQSNNFMVLTEILSKGVGKVVQGLQTAIKQQ